MADSCDDLSGPAWVYCMGLGAFESAVQSSNDASQAIANRAAASYDYAVSTGSETAQAAVSVGGEAVKGAQKATGKLTDAWRDTFKITPGGVAAIAAVGIGGALLADAYLTGGTVTRRVGRAVTGGRR